MERRNEDDSGELTVIFPKVEMIENINAPDESDFACKRIYVPVWQTVDTQ